MSTTPCIIREYERVNPKQVGKYSIFADLPLPFIQVEEQVEGEGR
jgi:hypothetical protein